MERRIKMTDRQLSLVLSCIRVALIDGSIYRRPIEDSQIDDDLEDVCYQLENLLGERRQKGRRK